MTYHRHCLLNGTMCRAYRGDDAGVSADVLLLLPIPTFKVSLCRRQHSELEEEGGFAGVRHLRREDGRGRESGRAEKTAPHSDDSPRTSSSATMPGVPRPRTTECFGILCRHLHGRREGDGEA